MTPKKVLKEFRFPGNQQFNVGDVIALDKFKESEYIDVTGTTKGKGYQGVVKRHGMSGGPAAHGTHLGREAGSTGMREHPGHVFKNHRMAGHMGNEQVTIQNLRIVKIDVAQNLMFVQGAVPGKNQGIVYIKTSVKKQ
jgi:large subunit ribosomal protein L3